MIGETLGPYVIERELGVGGMGKVYAATVTGRAPGIETGTRIALKLVHSHLLETPGFFKRFLREADVGKSVTHENVVRTYDADALIHDGTHHHFLVMEFVEGQTLRDLLVELDRVPEELCRHIGREVAKGLAAIHGVAVVHRDLKPENVLITEDQTVKVMDLGVARLQDEAIRLSQTGAFVGSVQYAAPEQFGGGHVDHRVDLHALGLLLYELGCGQQPYYDEDFRVSLQRLMNEEPRRVSEINPQLSPFYEEIVHTLIAKSQDDRIQTAEEVARLLEEGEESEWWEQRAKDLRVETKQPLRRIRVPRETSLYGRDDELAKLGALFEEVKAGDGRVLLVEGEAGIGKTRLVDEFVGQLRQAGEDLNFLFGTYPPGGAASAGGAFSTAFREHVGPEGSAPYLRETPLLVPAFDALLRGDATPTGAEPLTKESLVTCFVHATRAIAAGQPTILLIDDLQFAPEDARNLFSAVALAVPGHRVMLVGTVRPGVSQEWTANLTRLEHAQQISLPRLGPKDLVHLLKDTFRSERLATELGLQIALKSDGNPYYVFEIVRGLREGKYITQSDSGAWIRTQVIDRIQIPSSVMDLIQSRIADLTEEEKEILDVAACCGFEFDPGLVAEAAGLRRIPALRTFGRIEKTHRLIRSVGRNFSFDHYQVQEALYEGQPEQLREEYHAALAEALEEKEDAAEGDAKDLDGALCVSLCEHYLKGGRGKRARRYLDAALDYLEAAYLNDEAIRVTDLALGLPAVVTGEARVRLLLRKAGRVGLIGRHDALRETIESALALARRLDAPTLVAQAELSLAGHLVDGGQYDEAGELLNSALEAARTAGDKALEAVVENRRGGLCWSRGRYERASAHHERATVLAREIGDRQQEANSTHLQANTFLSLGRFEEAQARYEQNLALSREIGDRGREASSIVCLGIVFVALGNYAAAREHYERGLGRLRETGDRRSEAITLHNLADAVARLGLPAEAEERMRSALRIGREIGFRHFEAATLDHLGAIADISGRPDEAEGLMRAGAALFGELGLRDEYAARAQIRLAALIARRGPSDEVNQLLAEAKTIADEGGIPGAAILSRAYLAKLTDSSPADAVEALTAASGRLSLEDKMEARFILWEASGEHAHLTEACRLLQVMRDCAPEACVESMIQNVPLHSEIWAAATEAGL